LEQVKPFLPTRRNRNRTSGESTPGELFAVIKHLRRVQGGDIVLLHDSDHRKLSGDQRRTLVAVGYGWPAGEIQACAA
jgi:hypothetical protein